MYAHAQHAIRADQGSPGRVGHRGKISYQPPQIHRATRPNCQPLTKAVHMHTNYDICKYTSKVL